MDSVEDCERGTTPPGVGRTVEDAAPAGCEGMLTVDAADVDAVTGVPAGVGGTFAGVVEDDPG